MEPDIDPPQRRGSQTGAGSSSASNPKTIVQGKNTQIKEARTICENFVHQNKTLSLADLHPGLEKDDREDSLAVQRKIRRLTSPNGLELIPASCCSLGVKVDTDFIIGYAYSNYRIMLQFVC
jgi:hypothetical protein